MHVSLWLQFREQWEYRKTEDLHANQRKKRVDQGERINKLEPKGRHDSFIGKDNATCTDHLQNNLLGTEFCIVKKCNFEALKSLDSVCQA